LRAERRINIATIPQYHKVEMVIWWQRKEESKVEVERRTKGLHQSPNSVELGRKRRMDFATINQYRQVEGGKKNQYRNNPPIS
jgi:hypothetical protein